MGSWRSNRDSAPCWLLQNTTLIASISLILTIAASAGDKKQREWISGTLLAESKDAAGPRTAASRVISQAQDSVSIQRQYTVQTSDAIYTLKLFDPTPPGSSTRLPPPPAPKVQAGDAVKIAVKKNEVWLLDTAGKEHLCTIVNKVERGTKPD